MSAKRRVFAVAALIAVTLPTVLWSKPVLAAQLTGITDSDGLSGSCNMVMRGLADGLWEAGYRQDILCNAVIPSDAVVGGFANVPFPYTQSGNPKWARDSIGLAVVANCDINSGGTTVPYFGRGYDPPNGTGGFTENCGPTYNMYDAQTLKYLSYGATFTHASATYKAVQIRITVFRFDAEDVTEPGRVWTTDSNEAALLETLDNTCKANPTTAGLCMFSLAIKRGGGAAEFRNLGFAGSVTNEPLSQQTAPPVPADYFTGGSGTSLGPCSKSSWTGPADDTSYHAGAEYTWEVAYTGQADTIKWAWNDGQSPSWIEIPATGSPQTLRIVARATGTWIPIIHCVAGDVEETWGNYVNVDDQLIGGESELSECFDGTGIGINPASWVPAAGRVGACTLRVLFIPNETPLDSIQDAYAGRFPFSMIGDLVGMVETTLGAAQDGLEASACPHIDLRGIHPQLSSYSALDVRAPTPTGSGCSGAGGVAGDVGGYRSWLRTGARFGLWFLVMLGLSRKVGPKEGPVMVKP